MHKYQVSIEIFLDKGNKVVRDVVVEAGTKKLATIRALLDISKESDFKDLYKKIKSCELVG